MFLWLSMTPLLTPVVPEVKSISAKASGSATGSWTGVVARMSWKSGLHTDHIHLPAIALLNILQQVFKISRGEHDVHIS